MLVVAAYTNLVIAFCASTKLVASTPFCTFSTISSTVAAAACGGEFHADEVETRGVSTLPVVAVVTPLLADGDSSAPAPPPAPEAPVDGAAASAGAGAGAWAGAAAVVAGLTFM